MSQISRRKLQGTNKQTQWTCEYMYINMHMFSNNSTEPPKVYQFQELADSLYVSLYVCINTYTVQLCMLRINNPLMYFMYAQDNKRNKMFLLVIQIKIKLLHFKLYLLLFSGVCRQCHKCLDSFAAGGCYIWGSVATWWDAALAQSW